VINHMNL